MKVDLNQTQVLTYAGTGRSERSEAADAQQGASKQLTADKVDFSRVPSEAPASDVDVAREAQVAEIKTRVENGTYQVSGIAVAEKLVSRMLLTQAPPSASSAAVA
jgi:negative regulator of flagellin synthesis FlgM